MHYSQRSFYTVILQILQNAKEQSKLTHDWNPIPIDKQDTKMVLLLQQCVRHLLMRLQLINKWGNFVKMSQNTYVLCYGLQMLNNV